MEPTSSPTGPPRHLLDLDDLHALWRWVAGPWGYSVPQLFGVVVEPDGTVVPQIINVKDDPGEERLKLDPTLADNLVATLGHAVGPGSSVALMWARPGRGPSTRADREQLRVLHAALASATFAWWPLYFATEDGADIVAPDELAA